MAEHKICTCSFELHINPSENDLYIEHQAKDFQGKFSTADLLIIVFFLSLKTVLQIVRTHAVYFC